MKKEDIEPDNDQILYEIVSVERKTDAGLVLPTAEDEMSPVVGRVLAVAPGARYEIGTKIMLSRGVSFKVPLGGLASKDAAFLVDKKYVLAKVK